MKPSMWAIVVLIIVVLLLFGASKLPEVAGSIGKSLKIFKKEVKELREDTDMSPGSTGDQNATQGQYQSPTSPTASGVPPQGDQQPPGTPGAPPAQPQHGEPSTDGNHVHRP